MGRRVLFRVITTHSPMITAGRVEAGGCRAWRITVVDTGRNGSVTVTGDTLPRADGGPYR